MATVATLTALFKEIYSEEGVKNLIPDNLPLLKRVQFRNAEKIGKKFIQPVVLTGENGVSFAASGDGAFTINSPVAHVMGEAQVDGSQVLLAGRLDYEQAAKASSSKVAFLNSTEHLVKQMSESMGRNLELSFLYGQSGLGAATSSVNTDATHTVVQLTTASWASGIWCGMEGAQIQMYNANTNALISSGSDAIFVIDSVDADNRKLTLSGTATGIGVLDTFLALSVDANIYRYGSYGKECAGIDKIITNTGTLFNISAASYSLWKGNSYSAGSAALTMAKVLAAVGKAVARGLNQDVVVLVNPIGFQNLNSDQAALRKFDASYSKDGENGFEGLKFHGQNGMIEILSHNMVKEGEAFVVPLKEVKRIGAQEMTFKTPGREDEMFIQLQSSAGFELRCYSQQAIFVQAPAKCVKITAIVNS
jgi:hypothetical protein